MPELTAVTIALFALLLVAGTVLGWVLRGDRSAKEKIAINAGWQQQIESQQSEHDRLAKQNKSLMEQISQYQASMKDSTLRAKELSDSLKETFQRRDELQRQLKEVRSNLEVVVAERERLQGELRSKNARDSATEQAIQQRDVKIQKLTGELANWRSRVPPLVDRYRVRDEEARELENELAAARTELAEVQAALAEALAGIDKALVHDPLAEPEPDTVVVRPQENPVLATTKPPEPAKPEPPPAPPEPPATAPPRIVPDNSAAVAATAPTTTPTTRPPPAATEPARAATIETLHPAQPRAEAYRTSPLRVDDPRISGAPSAPPPPPGSTAALVWQGPRIDRLPEAKLEPRPRGFSVVAFDGLGSQVGSRVSLITSGGKEIEGKVIAVSGDGVTVQMNRDGGQARLFVERRRILEIRLLGRG